MTGDVVVVLTALNLEYDAVRRRLTDLQTEQERGTRFELGRLPGTGCRIALGLTGKGNHTAGVLAERATRRYSPVAVLFVGVAGALWDTTKLGDVVVATHVYAYHGGTAEDDHFRTRPRVWETDHGIAQVAAHVARTADWADITPDGCPPTVHFGPVAAGEVVVNSYTSIEARRLRDTYNDALAVEMESAGVAQAGHLGGAPVAIVRGISDHADGTKNSAGDRTSQPQAAANAAAFAVRLAEHLIIEQESRMSTSPSRRPGGMTVHNTASGTVGIQAGHVTGSSVFISAAPPSSTPIDVPAELTALRQELLRARGAGELDEPTYRAAEAELDAATDELASSSDESKSRFVLALKRLRGLVDDVAGIAATIASLISTVTDLR